MGVTRTVLFPGLWGGFFVDITWIYLLPCRFEFLFLRNNCCCSRSLDLGFHVAATHCAVWLSWVKLRNLDLEVSPLTLFWGRGLGSGSITLSPGCRLTQQTMSLLTTARSHIPRQSLRLNVLAPSILHRPTPRHTRSVKTEPAYPGHIPLNWIENAFMAVGSAFMSLADPRRGGKQHYFYDF